MVVGAPGWGVRLDVVRMERWARRVVASDYEVLVYGEWVKCGSLQLETGDKSCELWSQNRCG